MTTADQDPDADLRLVSEARDRLLAERKALLARLAKIDAALGRGVAMTSRRKRSTADVIGIVRQLGACTGGDVIEAVQAVEPTANAASLRQRLLNYTRSGRLTRTVGEDGQWVYEVAK